MESDPVGGEASNLSKRLMKPGKFMSCSLILGFDSCLLTRLPPGRTPKSPCKQEELLEGCSGPQSCAFFLHPKWGFSELGHSSPFEGGAREDSDQRETRMLSHLLLQLGPPDTHRQPTGANLRPAGLAHLPASQRHSLPSPGMWRPLPPSGSPRSHAAYANSISARGAVAHATSHSELLNLSH